MRTIDFTTLKETALILTFPPGRRKRRVHRFEMGTQDITSALLSRWERRARTPVRLGRQ